MMNLAFFKPKDQYILTEDLFQNKMNLNVYGVKPDQTLRMHGLIWVYTRCVCHKVSFCPFIGLEMLVPTIFKHSKQGTRKS